MPTPSTYNQRELKRIVDNAKADGIRLFHHTKIAYLESIAASRALYSLGTLWGLDSEWRKTIAGNRPEISAEAGFIDYVYLTKVNRLSSGLDTIYGHIAFELDLDILLARDFFVYPFNIGYDWRSPEREHQKRSDLTTLSHSLSSDYLSDEFLVRRKVPADFFRKIHCFEKDLAAVRKELAVGKWKLGVEVTSPSATLARPDFGIELFDRKPLVTIPSHELFFHSRQADILIHKPNQSNCLAEFRVWKGEIYPVVGSARIGRKVFNRYLKTGS